MSINKDLENDFNNWVENLEKQEQPEACSIDNPDCDSCGS